MIPLVSEASRCTIAGALRRTKCALRLTFFQSARSDLSSLRTRSSVRSSATVRTMTPPASFGRYFDTICLSRSRSSRDSILRLTPTLDASGRYTRKRPASDTCAVTRGPFVPIGSLLIFSTVYLWYHYVIDLIGGLAFMIFAVWSAKYIFNWWRRKIGKPEFNYGKA